MKRRTVLLFALGLLLLVVGSATRRVGWDIPRPERLEQEAGLEPAPLAGPVRASGTVQADEIHIATETGGRIVEIPWEAGERVAAGDVLVTLDATTLLGKVAEAEAAVAVAEADLAVVRAGTRPEERLAALATVRLAEAEARGARMAWEDAQTTVENPQQLDAQIADARTKVALAEQAVELAEAELAQEQWLRDQQPNGLEREVATLRVRSREEALAAAEADQNTAQTLLNRLWGMRNEPLALMAAAAMAEGEYRLAAAQVAVERARLDDMLDGPTAEEIAVAEAQVAFARSQVAVLEAQLEKFTISSPTSGVILEQVARAGEVVAPAATVLKIADLSEVTLVMYVPVERIDELFVEQGVSVSVDGYPEQSFHGRVSTIGAEPEYTPRNILTEGERRNTFFEVTVRLPNPEGYLKPGMLAEATFEG